MNIDAVNLAITARGVGTLGQGGLQDQAGLTHGRRTVLPGI
jgi:hypothetical protein